jgi:glutathione peroxidase
MPADGKRFIITVPSSEVRPMKLASFVFSAALLIAGISSATQVVVAAPAAPADCPTYLDQTFRKLHSSQSVNLCKEFAGKPLLIVNTASHCGFTPQFKGLEAVNAKYKGRGLVVVGFSSDDFNQEAKDEAEAADTCFLNYGVTFTMLAPQHVKGAGANPVFKELARQSQEPKWNFNKYLVSADGKVAQYFDSRVAPDSPEFQAAVEKLLK